MRRPWLIYRPMSTSIVGQLPVPTWGAPLALRAVAAHQGLHLDSLLPVDYVERVTMTASQVTVSYHSGRGTADRLRAALVPLADQQRMRAYQVLRSEGGEAPAE